MSKRIKQSLGFRILKNTMAAIGVLFVLLGIMAIMMQKGIVKTEWLHFGLIAVCLLTGVLAQLIESKGEKGIYRLLPCGIPAILLLLVAFLSPTQDREPVRSAVYSLCLVLPALVRLALGGRSSKKERMRWKSRRRTPLRR